MIDTSDLSYFPNSAIELAARPKIRQGEATQSQVPAKQQGLPAFSQGQLAGFGATPAGTYAVYRQISAYPTVSLVMSIVKSPIIANQWVWKKRHKDIPDLWVRLLDRIIAPQRHRIVTNMLRSLEFGWAPFEKVFRYKTVDLGDIDSTSEAKFKSMTPLQGDDAHYDAMVLEDLKPLTWDHTKLFEKKGTGEILGLENDVPGRDKVFLPKIKSCWHVNDPHPDLPYGRSRHENIRTQWSQASQLSDRVAQYMKKIAGIVVQLHYPEGQSLDVSGAPRPNQWLGQSVLDAVSAGLSVMFPNGFASIDSTIDPKGAFDLAGKSQWQLSTLNTGGTDYAPGMKEILEYYDQLLFMGWLRPGRTGLEARYGSRADAHTHSETGIYDCEAIDKDIADTINRDVLNDLLTLNFGESARDAVYIEPLPISDSTIDNRLKVLTTILQSVNGIAATQQIDVRTLCDDLDVPLVSNDPSVNQPLLTDEQGNPTALPETQGQKQSPQPGGTGSTPPKRTPLTEQQHAQDLQKAGYSQPEIDKRLAKRRKQAQ